MNRNSKIRKQHTAKVFNTSLAVGMAALMGFTPVMATPVFAASADSADTEDSSDKDVDKDETVYVNADPSGSASKITVSDHLYNTDGSSTIEDASDLKDIENVKGDEDYSGSGSNMTWKADGNDIYYQGTSSKKLPIGVKFTYYLDGKEISADDLAGKSGKLTIKIEYTNHTDVTTEVNGEDTKTQSPFVMMTGLIMPDDTFTNITVDNGKIVNDGTRSIVIGYGMPGLADALDLSKIKQSSKDALDDVQDAKDKLDKTADTEDADDDQDKVVSSSSASDDGDSKADTKDSKDDDDKDVSEKIDDAEDDIDDFNIPESVEITADVKNFSLDSTYTIAMSDLFNGVDFEDVDSVSDVKDLIDTAKDKAVELADGCQELYDGTSELNSRYSDMDDGVKALKQGLDQLASGTEQYTNGVDLFRRKPAQQRPSVQLIQHEYAVQRSAEPRRRCKIRGGWRQISGGWRKVSQ